MFLLLIFVAIQCIFIELKQDYTSSDALVFSQILDHFNPASNEMFNQRYFENTDYQKDPSGPFLLYICGESPCGGIPSSLTDYAKELGAGMLALEHRYYGESCPFDKDNLDVKDLVYLSSRQGLEDLAFFRTSYQEKHGDHGNKWIIIGGSYSGAMSAFARYKYPHLFDGAWSSSGVVDTKYEFPEFDEQIRASAGPECADALAKATVIVQDLVDNTTTRNTTLKMFDSQDMELGDFYYLLADMVVMPIQYGVPDELCDRMIGSEDLLKSFVDVYTNVFKGYFHLSTADYSVETMKKKNNYYIRMWWWQKCADMGYYQIAPKTNPIRSKHVNIEYHKETCKNAFGLDNIERNVRASQWHYGETKIYEETKNDGRIFFGNGSQDPWKRAGILRTGDERVYEVTCHNCGHCVDLRGCPGGCTDGDKAYHHARELVMNAMKDWVK